MAQKDWLVVAERLLVADNNAIAILSMDSPDKDGEMLIGLKRADYLLKPKRPDDAKTLMDLWVTAEHVWLIKQPNGKVVIITDFWTTTIEIPVTDYTEQPD